MLVCLLTTSLSETRPVVPPDAGDARLSNTAVGLHCRPRRPRALPHRTRAAFPGGHYHGARAGIVTSPGGGGDVTVRVRWAAGQASSVGGRRMWSSSVDLWKFRWTARCVMWTVRYSRWIVRRWIMWRSPGEWTCWRCSGRGCGLLSCTLRSDGRGGADRTVCEVLEAALTSGCRKGSRAGDISTSGTGSRR